MHSKKTALHHQSILHLRSIKNPIVLKKIDDVSEKEVVKGNTRTTKSNTKPVEAKTNDSQSKNQNESSNN